MTLIVCFLTVIAAQDFRDELRFAEALRSRGDADLALEVLGRLEKTAAPEQKKELPLEFAKTRLRLASDEAETTKRLALYRQARTDFESFIAGNAGHPRIPEATLEVARVLNAVGKTELGQALLSDDGKTKATLAAQSRATLEEAFKRLKAAEQELMAAVKKLPDPDGIEDAAKKKAAAQALAQATNDVSEAKFEMGINKYDQSETYLRGSDEKASALLIEAKKLLDPLAAGDPASPVTWKAMAWTGRIIAETEKADDARARFTQVMNAPKANLSAAADGIRLARYFRLHVLEKNPDKADDMTSFQVPGQNARVFGTPGRVLDAGERWLIDYGRSHKTPEGYGLKFLLASMYLGQAEGNKKLDEGIKARFRTRARNLLRDLEHTENEFTDRARRLKIQTMRAQGTFRIKIEALKSFDDCYVRAQYEASRLNVDPIKDKEDELKALPDPKDITSPAEKAANATARKAIEAELAKLKEPGALEKQRKQHVDNIMAALKKGLALPDVAKKNLPADLDSARLMYAYWALQTGDLAETVRVGEEFIRTDPRSPQAAMTAVYTLQALSQRLDALRGKADEKDLAEARDRLFSLGAYAEARWGQDAAGDMARHTLGLQLMKEENFPEAIRRMSLVSPKYGNYPLVCLQLADLCKKAEKAGSEPIVGDRDAKDYRKRAVLALDRIPLTGLGPDPFTNQVAVGGKIEMMRGLFAYKRFDQMDALATQLLPLTDKLRFSDEDDKHKAIKDQLRFELMDLGLYAKYGLADAALAAGDNVKAAALLDPLVDVLSKPGDSQEKTNLQKNVRLATVILTVALKANLQQGKIDRTDLTLEALSAVAGEDGGGAVGTIQLLAFLIRGQVEELRKKGDKEALDAAVKGYTDILTKRTEKLEKTPELIRALAACYSSLQQHDKAAAELAAVKGDEKDPAWKGARLMYVQQLRMSKTEDNLKKAREVLTEMRGAPGGKVGWGMRDLTAMTEHGLLLHEEGKWAEAFTGWAALVKTLGPQIAKGGPTRERYFEVYFYMVQAGAKLAQARAGQADRDKGLESVARQMMSLESSWPDLGGDASKARFEGLLQAEAGLKAKYDELKAKKK